MPSLYAPGHQCLREQSWAQEMKHFMETIKEQINAEMTRDASEVESIHSSNSYKTQTERDFGPYFQKILKIKK